MQNSYKKAFTLLELLLAVLISSIVFIALSKSIGSWQKIATNYNSIEKFSIEHQRIKLWLEKRFNHYIKGTFVNKNNGYQFYSESDEMLRGVGVNGKNTPIYTGWFDIKTVTLEKLNNDIFDNYDLKVMANDLESDGVDIKLFFYENSNKAVSFTDKIYERYSVSLGVNSIYLSQNNELVFNANVLSKNVSKFILQEEQNYFICNICLLSNGIENCKEYIL